MRTMNVITKIFEWLNGFMKMLGGLCLVGMTVLTCVDVTGRFFGHPIFGSVELVGFMSTLSVAMALPYTHQVKAHIGVELLVRLFSEKTQAIIDIVMSIFGLALVFVITWRMFVYANTKQESGEVSMSLQFPEHVIIYLVGFCFAVFFLTIIVDIYENIQKLRGAK